MALRTRSRHDRENQPPNHLAGTVTNEGNGQKHRAITNSTGYYVVPNLFVGSYAVEVETAGFKKSVQSGVTGTVPIPGNSSRSARRAPQ